MTEEKRDKHAMPREEYMAACYELARECMDKTMIRAVNRHYPIAIKTTQERLTDSFQSILPPGYWTAWGPLELDDGTGCMCYVLYVAHKCWSPILADRNKPTWLDEVMDAEWSFKAYLGPDGTFAGYPIRLVLQDEPPKPSEFLEQLQKQAELNEGKCLETLTDKASTLNAQFKTNGNPLFGKHSMPRDIYCKAFCELRHEDCEVRCLSDTMPDGYERTIKTTEEVALSRLRRLLPEGYSAHWSSSEARDLIEGVICLLLVIPTERWDSLFSEQGKVRWLDEVPAGALPFDVKLDPDGKFEGYPIELTSTDDWKERRW